MTILKIIVIIFLAIGALITFGSNKINSRYGLEKKMKCKFEDQLKQEELIDYKRTKAEFYIKVTGMVISLISIVFILVLF